MSKKIVYIDMDNVLVDFKSGLDQVPEDIKAKYGDYIFGLEYDPSGEVFWIIEPIYNSDIKSHAYSAIEIGKRIKEFFDVFPNRKGEHTVVVDYTIE
jgi:FMN phosphatase YigB (HAD superfamily)